MAPVPGVLARAKCTLWTGPCIHSHPLSVASAPCLTPAPPTPPALRSEILLTQGEEHGLGRVLEEGRPVLLLPLLHPVTIDPESVGVDESPQWPEGVGVSNDDLPGHGLHPAVLVVDAHGSQHRQADHLRGARPERRATPPRPVSSRVQRRPTGARMPPSLVWRRLRASYRHRPPPPITPIPARPASAGF